jgi:hypothetical protein
MSEFQSDDSFDGNIITDHSYLPSPYAHATYGFNDMVDHLSAMNTTQPELPTTQQPSSYHEKDHMDGTIECVSSTQLPSYHRHRYFPIT